MPGLFGVGLAVLGGGLAGIELALAAAVALLLVVMRGLRSRRVGRAQQEIQAAEQRARSTKLRERQRLRFQVGQQQGCLPAGAACGAWHTAAGRHPTHPPILRLHPRLVPLPRLAARAGCCRNV